jgi:hypothetical protein
MNTLSLFKYLEKEKGKPIPLKLKIIHGLPVTPEELDVKGYLILYNSKITSLPQGLKVRKALFLGYNPITSLPKGLKVGEHFNLEHTEISFLPSDLQVERYIWIENTPLAQKSDEEIRAMLTTGYIKGNIYR